MPSENPNENSREKQQGGDQASFTPTSDLRAEVLQHETAPQPSATNPQPPAGYAPAQPSSANPFGAHPDKGTSMNSASVPDGSAQTPLNDVPYQNGTGQPLDSVPPYGAVPPNGTTPQNTIPAPNNPTPPYQAPSQSEPPLQQGTPSTNGVPSGFGFSSQNATNPQLDLSAEDTDQLVRARKLALLANIGAVASFFIGGILLNTVALVAGFLSYRRYTSVCAEIQNNDQAVRAYKRMAITAIVIPAVCLAVNIAFFIMVYPVLLQSLQTGEYGDIFGSLGSTGGTGTTTSTWG